MSRESPDPPAPGRRRHRNRPRHAVTLAAIVVLFVLITLVHRGSDAKSSSLPAGHWGATIACLERDTLNTVTDANAPTGAVPDSHTTEVVVTSRVPHRELAVIRDAGTAAAARAAARRQTLGEPAGSVHVAGSIAWAFSEGGDPPHAFANAGQMTLIDFCIEPHAQ